MNISFHTSAVSLSIFSPTQSLTGGTSSVSAKCWPKLCSCHLQGGQEGAVSGSGSRAHSVWLFLLCRVTVARTATSVASPVKMLHTGSP